MIESYYVPEKTITNSQKKYVKILQDTFNVFSMKENKYIPYNPVSWQQEFHSYSLNALHKKLWCDRLVVKGRGISFSVSSMMDMIMSGAKFKNIIIPIVSHRIENAIDLITVGQKLIDNANVNFDVKKPFTKKEIIFENTGSVIRAYPSSNQDALRQLRTFTGLLDEISFYRNIKGVLDAAESTTSEGGQLTIGSTVYDRNNYFWEMYQQQKAMRNKFVFTLPIFDPTKFDINRNILTQVKEGLQPLVWWQSMRKLEDKRCRDHASFLRENQCTPSDEGVNFLSIDKILRNVNEKLKNYSHFETNNMLFGGLDVASYKDYVGIVIFELTPFGMVMRHCRAIKGIELPDLQKLIETEYLSKWNFTKFRIDMTGMGTQLAQYLRRKFGGVVEMIHFGTSVEGGLVGKGTKVSVGSKLKESIRDKMAWNLRYLFEDDKIKIIDDGLLVKHLNSWSWDLRKCLSTDGHGDLFWACGLALLPLNYKMVQSKMIIKSGIEQQHIDDSSLPQVEVEWKK